MKLFNQKEDKKKTKKKDSVDLAPENTEEAKASSDVSFKAEGKDAYKVFRSFYISEKAASAQAMNQYVFRVAIRANKSEIKKEISRLFDVKVKAVKILNMPEKRRDLGKHPGFKSGFKKAMVVLEKGYTIGQAKP